MAEIKSIAYLCDPEKNKECPKAACYMNNKHPDWGECRFSCDPKHSKDGKRYIYNEKTSEYVEIK